jgi:hypothetical protein
MRLVLTHIHSPYETFDVLWIGITNFTYIPPSLPVKQSDWPTLGSMIDSGKRVVVFLDSEADGPDPANFILPEFSMVTASYFPPRVRLIFTTLDLGNTFLRDECVIPVFRRPYPRPVSHGGPHVSH